jgi:hypothetical protein
MKKRKRKSEKRWKWFPQASHGFKKQKENFMEIKERIASNPNRRKITKVEELATGVIKADVEVFDEGTITEEGTLITAELLNSFVAKADGNLGNVALPVNGGARGVDYVVEYETAISGSNTLTQGWYRKWKSGWVEQGGFVVTPYVDNDQSVERAITLPVPMQPNENYSATVSLNWTHSNWQNIRLGIAQRSATRVDVRIFANGGWITSNSRISWQVAGMSAEGGQ